MSVFGSCINVLCISMPQKYSNTQFSPAISLGKNLVGLLRCFFEILVKRLF